MNFILNLYKNSYKIWMVSYYNIKLRMQNLYHDNMYILISVYNVDVSV